MARPSWYITGAVTAPDRAALAEALRLVHTAARRPPTDADAPPVSTFPMTAGARTALELGKRSRREQSAA